MATSNAEGSFRLLLQRFAAPIATVAAALLAAGPLRAPRLPHGTDTVFHLYSLVQLEALVEAGNLWSRWFPHQASGFGLPLFQYYPPLAAYVSLISARLGASPVAAIRATLALGFLLAAAGMYGWARRRFSPGVAAFCSALYTVSPYLLYNAYARGGLAEHAALAVIPWLFWGIAATRGDGASRGVASAPAATISVARVAVPAGLLVLAHLLTAAVVLPAAWLYAFTAGLPDGSGRWRTGARISGGLLLGLGLAAFYWLPAIAERGAIIDTLSLTPDLDFHGNFLSWGKIVATPGQVTLRAALHPVAMALAIFALAAAVRQLLRWRQGFPRPGGQQSGTQWTGLSTVEVLLGTGFVLAAIVMSTRLSLPVWELLPELRFFQFPQRFLALALPWATILAGDGLERVLAVAPGRFRKALLSGAYGVAFLTLIPLGAVRHWPPLPEISVDFIMEKERAAGMIGTLYIGSFVPTTVKRLPPYERLAQDGPERLRRDRVPASVRLLKESWRPLRYEIDAESTEDWTAHFETFAFAGWKAKIDGEPVALQVEPPNGTLAVAVPAGHRRLEVWFASTPLRGIAGGISFLALVTTSGLFLRRRLIRL